MKFNKENEVGGAIFSVIIISGILGFVMYDHPAPNITTALQSATQAPPTKAPPCLTGAVPATITDTTQNPPEKLPWWETHSTTCPSNMRMVYPSDREVRRGYNVDVMSSSYDSDGSMNWRYQHITCIPDGLRAEN